MALDPSRVRDYASIFGDFRVPSASLEIRRSVGTGSIAFSSSLDVGKGYFVACYGADGVFGLGSSGPTFDDALCATQGVPLTEGVYYPFVPPDTASTTLRVSTMSGTADFEPREVSVSPI